MNRMNSIKSAALIRKLACFFIIICLLSLTACMTKEDKEKAKDNERLARPIVQEYLKLNYGSGKIDYLKCLNSPGKGTILPDFYKNPSSYVKASVIVNKKEFSVITNVITGQCYDNYNEQLVAEDFKNCAVSSLSIAAPYDVEVHYYLKDLDGELPDSKYDGFTEYGIKSVKDLYKKDRYQIYVVCKYITSDMNFGSVDVKRFFPSEVSEVYLALVNFRSKDRYISGDMASLNDFNFNNHQHYYSLSDVVTAVKEKKYDEKSDKFVYDDSVDYNYSRYLSKSINGIEFAWNDFAYALDFEVIPAEKELQTRDTDSKIFYSTNDKAVLVRCTSLLDDMDESDDRFYCFFDKALYNKEVVVNDSGNSYKKYDEWTLNFKTDSYIYQWLSPNDKKTLFTLGFYKRK